MREIKFRAWDTKKKIFDYEPLICRGKCCFIDSFDNFEEHEEGRMVLQQYTGLKDKNGKEIYEGDVVGLNLFAESQRNEGEVVWDIDYAEYRLQFKLYDLELWSSLKYHDGEITGNIYENLNFLEVN